MYQNCCKKCGSTDLFVKKGNTTTGLYCSDCGAWIKWVGKDELRAFEHSKEKEENKITEYKMCASVDMAIYILEFIKQGYAKNYQDAGVRKYIEALQMGIDALVEKSKEKK